LRRRTSGLWAAAGIKAKTKRSGTRIILRSESILPELAYSPPPGRIRGE
jgi:hypothetical protein